MSVKPLVHWVIYKEYKVRFTERRAHEVEGILTTPDGPVAFRYETEPRRIHLPQRSLTINEYGWEEEQDARSQPESAGSNSPEKASDEHA